ncbi:hypothetical protein ACFY4B_18760 [Kitasatospora sp. NPDC001261]|uniref:hypothetical protein n=1 Tax=Kitasatospora sp. NPDC001261 TaxID=3364012 RepID=UPI00368E3618
MATAAHQTPPEPEARSAAGERTGPRAGTGPGERTGPAGRTLRAVAAVHTAAAFGQPVFAGVYLSGDYDALGWHTVGANAVTALGYLQLVAALVVWIRLRRSWPAAATLAAVAAETAQYVAGTEGALWLHLPLGVATIAGLAVLTIALWRTPLPPRRPLRREDDDRA